MEILFKKYFPLLFFVFSILFLSRALLLSFYPDFTSYYFGAKAAIVGANPYISNNNFFAPYIYPPPALLFFFPFLALPFPAASKLWTGLSICFLMLSFYFIFKIFKESLFEHKNLIISAIIFITFFPTKYTLGMGQINIFIFLLLVLTIYHYFKNNKYLSGMYLGVSLVLKMFPVFLPVYFLVKKEWKLLFITLSSCVAIIIITYFATGTSSTLYFLKIELPAVLTGWKSDYYNQALTGFLARGIADMGARNFLKILLTGLLIIISFYTVVLKAKKDVYFENLKISILILLTLIVNTFSWQHHFVWFLFPIIATYYFIRANNLSKTFLFLLTLSYIMVALNFKNPGSFPLILQSHVFLGTILLWATNVYLVLKLRTN